MAIEFGPSILPRWSPLTQLALTNRTSAAAGLDNAVGLTDLRKSGKADGPRVITGGTGHGRSSARLRSGTWRRCGRKATMVGAAAR